MHKLRLGVGSLEPPLVTKRHAGLASIIFVRQEAHHYLGVVQGRLRFQKISTSISGFPNNVGNRDVFNPRHLCLHSFHRKDAYGFSTLCMSCGMRRKLSILRTTAITTQSSQAQPHIILNLASFFMVLCKMLLCLWSLMCNPWIMMCCSLITNEGFHVLFIHNQWVSPGCGELQGFHTEACLT